MATMEKWMKYALGTALVVYLAGGFGVGGLVNFNAPSPIGMKWGQWSTPGVPSVVTTTAATTPLGAGQPFAIQFTLKAQNGTALTSRSVDFYHYESGGGWWVKDYTATTDATGSVSSSAVYVEGQEIYVNVPHVANVYGDWWQKVVAKTWRGTPFTTLQIRTVPVGDRPQEDGQMTVYGTTIAANRQDTLMYNSANTALSETNTIAGATALSKASGAANMKGWANLIIQTTAWQSFGGKIEVPKTNQGATARSLVAVVYIEMNVTSISFDTAQSYSGAPMTWQGATATTATSKRFVIEVPRIEARDTYPTIYKLNTFIDFSGLADNTGVHISFGWTDQQTIDDAKSGVTYAGSGANIGYMRTITHDFYVYITA